jgi:aspartyl-tRNA(Asn)/glutamyl-tRNA(Gln) amidotransferase subunit A
MREELYRLTAHELRDGFRAGEFSSQQVTQAYLERIADTDGRIDAYVDVWSDYAIDMARAVDKRRAAGEDLPPLAGVPIALKDNLCTTQGMTECCSRILKGFRSPYDATVVCRLRDAGAVFLGKLNMDEFAMGSSTENSSVKKTRNPWNLACVPGGSSGGAAASVAADSATLSLGSDTGGSIRQPAALCGCVGMKPTYGRVSRYGLVAFASSLDQIGPFTKDTEDLALALNAICGRDPMDATSPDLPEEDFTTALNRDIKGLRIGLPREYYSDALNAEMRKIIEKAIAVLQEKGAEVVEVSLPHTEYAIAVYYIICTAEASANLARFDGVRYAFRHPDAKSVEDMYRLTKSEGFGPEVQRRIMLGTYALSSGYYDAYYLKAQKVRALIRRDFDEAFEKCDVIVTPTSPTAAFRFGEKTDDPLEMYLSDIYTSSTNLAGIPGVSIPCGLTADGLPAGLQLIGKAFDEATLIRVAHAYERAANLQLGHAPVA